MSEQIPIIEARERLCARLWSGECALDGDSQLAIAGHRLWCALREQRFNARQEGRGLSPYDMTEVLRRRLFVAAGLTVDADGFTEWIGSVVPLTSPPSTPFMTAVEAASFLVRGAFLTTDDITAIAAAQIKLASSVEVIGQPRNTLRELAEHRLFRAHVDGALTLLGRRAPCFGADPVSEAAPVPREFLSGNVTLGSFNRIYDRDEAARPTYWDVKISTTEFTAAFLISDVTVTPSSNRAGKRRAPTRTDAQEFKAWANEQYEKYGSGPSLKEAYEFAVKSGLNRDWSRDQYKRLPPELRRSRGGKGSTKYLAKRREQPSSQT
jgi:hypothetical protein